MSDIGTDSTVPPPPACPAWTAKTSSRAPNNTWETLSEEARQEIRNSLSGPVDEKYLRIPFWEKVCHCGKHKEHTRNG